MRLAFALLLLATSLHAQPIDVIHLVWKSSDDGTPGTRDEWVTRGS